MAQMVQMTTEQLQQLIEAVRVSAATGAAVNVTETKSKVTYKEIESISDEDALKGISLLFYGMASTWWQGVRKEAKTWNDVLALIRDHFSPTKPAYQIYVEIFDNKQDDKTAIDTFVCQKRALLAQLPDGRHDEETEIDLIYELLMAIKFGTPKYIPIS
ncbi:hypothetical protein DOY81_012974 [Sarcophaga bullata]|nr:hypothetical protein DOY81_012974 [Sarcophaga bullata]